MMKTALVWAALLVLPAVSGHAACSDQGGAPYYCFQARAWHQWDQFKAYRTFINPSAEFLDQCVVPALGDWVLGEEQGSSWKDKRPKDWDYTKDYSKAEVQDSFLAAASLAAIEAREKSLTYRKWQDDSMNRCVYSMRAPRDYGTLTFANTKARFQTTPDVITKMLNDFFLPGRGASDALTRKAALVAGMMPKDNAAALFAAGLEKIAASQSSPETRAAAVRSLGAIRPDLATDKVLAPLLAQGKEGDPSLLAAVCEALGAIVRKAVRENSAKDLKVLEARIPGLQEVGREAPENSPLKTACYQAFTSYPREIRCKYMACRDEAPAAPPAAPAKPR